MKRKEEHLKTAVLQNPVTHVSFGLDIALRSLIVMFVIFKYN